LRAKKKDVTPSALVEQLKSDGLAPKAVIAACMHKLIRQIYGVLKSCTAFDATFLENRRDFQDGI
jgi:transposase